MDDNFVFVDIVYRSRMTLLDILESRDYDVEKFRKFSPAEALAAVSAYPSLSFKTAKKSDPTKVCHVMYQKITRVKLDTFLQDIEDDVAPNTEIIVMMPDLVGDAHHAASIKEYLKLKENSDKKEKRGLRVYFFNIEQLVVNPLKHILVPKHEIVPEEQHKQLLESMYITSKLKLPEIKYHTDPITRCIGAAPGDIIRITRYSPSAGEAIIYRICTP